MWKWEDRASGRTDLWWPAVWNLGGKNWEMRVWGGGGGEVKFFIIYCKWKKEMEKPVNVRNVERSLLKRVVDDVMRLNWYFWHPKYQWNQKHITLKHITLFQCCFFLRTNQNLRPYIVSLILEFVALVLCKFCIAVYTVNNAPVAKMNNGFVK